MIIERFRIKNLFGKNYDVQLNSDINFLYGENGCGKTVLMEAINSVLSGDYDFLKKAEVTEVIIDVFRNLDDKSSDCIYISQEDIKNDIYKLSNYAETGKPSSIFIEEEYDSVKAEFIRSKMNSAFEEKNTAAIATGIMKIVNELLTGSNLFICGIVRGDLCLSSGDNVFNIARAGSGLIQVLYLFTKLLLDNTGNGTVFLIDMPEAHMHVDIQRRIVDAIMECTDNQLIIATHSPEIIASFGKNMINVSGTRYKETKV